MVYPWKRSVPDKMKAGAVSRTLFEVSDNRWINKELFLVWLQHFIDWIPPVRPVLLIMDGHFSHVTIEAIELVTSKYYVRLQKVWNIPFQSRGMFFRSSSSSFKSCHPTTSYFEFTRSVSVLS